MTRQTTQWLCVEAALLFLLATGGDSVVFAGADAIIHDEWATTILLGLDKTTVAFGERILVSFVHATEHELKEKDLVLTLHWGVQRNIRQDSAVMRITTTTTTTKLNETTSLLQWEVGQFPVVREETCQFRLLRELRTRSTTTKNVVVALSPILHVSNALETPTALHLAWGSDGDHEMVVSFATGVKGRYPVVEYQAVDENRIAVSVVEMVARGNTTTYQATDMCQEPAILPENFVSPGFLHSAVLSRLQPHVKYRYRVAIVLDSHKERKDLVWSRYYTFRTPPPLEKQTPPWKFLVLADQGVTPMARHVVKQLMQTEYPSSSPQLLSIHHVGDLSYAMGMAHVWDDWFQMIQPYATQTPLMITMGNHEYDYTHGHEHDPSGSTPPYRPWWGNYGGDSGGECGVPVARRFTMPAGGNGVFWYSHNLQNVHFVSLSSEHDLTRSSDQYQWLSRNLRDANQNRTLTPWIIVQIHRPLYMGEDFGRQNLVTRHIRANLEPLLAQNGVSLVLSGHYHAYLRTCTGLYRSACRGPGEGPTYITTGTAGAPLDPGFPLAPQWTRAFHKRAGYGRVTVHNATVLHYEFVAASSGKVVDDVYLVAKKDMLLLDVTNI